jgi:hypothetical protein
MKATSIISSVFGLLALLPAVSAAEPCNAIKPDRQRLACFDREALRMEPNGKPTSGSPSDPAPGVIDPVDLLKAENEKLSIRLKGICRGC